MGVWTAALVICVIVISCVFGLFRCIWRFFKEEDEEVKHEQLPDESFDEESNTKRHEYCGVEMIENKEGN